MTDFLFQEFFFCHVRKWY